jgi:hypothetical protein
MAGLHYEPGELPVCWVNWALQYERVDIAARNHFRLEAEAARRGADALGE